MSPPPTTGTREEPSVETPADSIVAHEEIELQKAVTSPPSMSEAELLQEIDALRAEQEATAKHHKFMRTQLDERTEQMEVPGSHSLPPTALCRCI